MNTLASLGLYIRGVMTSLKSKLFLAVFIYKDAILIIAVSLITGHESML